MNTFRATIERRNGDPAVHVLTAQGRLDVSGVAILEDALDEVHVDARARVVFDLARVTFVGSAGIGLLLTFVEQIRGVGGDARFVNVPAPVLAVLSLLNVADFLTQAENEESALVELRG
jgi:anti-sigma B factor antagonist